MNLKSAQNLQAISSYWLRLVKSIGYIPWLLDVMQFTIHFNGKSIIFVADATLFF